ncbi:MAG: hypothetical protein AAF581_05950 [Planctomycetota bacterium]
MTLCQRFAVGFVYALAAVAVTTNAALGQGVGTSPGTHRPNTADQGSVPVAVTATAPSSLTTNHPLPLPVDPSAGVLVNFASTGPFEQNSATPFGNCAVPCTGTPEGENCGQVNNDGCNVTPFDAMNFVDANCGGTYCGTVWADAGSRDTDYYRLELSQVTTITAELVANAPVVIALFAPLGGDCAGLDSFAVAFDHGNCTPATVSATVPGGTYYIFIANDPGNGFGLFSGVPCGSNNHYSLTIDCAPQCQLTAAGVAENEPLPTSTNAGCEGPPFQVQPIANGAMVRGTVWAANGNRDSDWFEFTVPPGDHLVDATLTAEFPALFYLRPTSCQAGILDQKESVRCSTAAIGALLPGGTYILAVIPGSAELGFTSDGIPLNDPANEYLLTLDIAPAPPPCTLTCSGTPEPDPCGTNTDDGCTGSFHTLPTDGTPICGTVFADNGTRDLDWYQFAVPVGTTVALTVESEFPAQVVLGRCGVLPGFIDVIEQQNGIGCAVDPVQINATLAAGSYLVLVTTGTGPLSIGDTYFGYPCTGNTGYRVTLNTTLPTSSCDVTCGGTPESETCGQTTNNGCNLPVPAFEPISFGTTRCGSVWADDNNRDSDWWSFTLTEPSSISWIISGELPLNSFIVDPTNCETISVISQLVVTTGNCAPAFSGAIELPCGDYALFIGPGDDSGQSIYHGFPCGGRNEYEFALLASPSTACPEPVITMDANCNDATIAVAVDAQFCTTGAQLVVTSPQGQDLENQTIPGFVGPCETLSITLGPFTDTGVYTFTWTANCCLGGSVSTTAEVYLPVYTNQTEIIWNAPPNNVQRPPGYQEAIPSEVLLNNILLAPPINRNTLVISDLLAFDCTAQLGRSHTLWVLLGTFPDNHRLEEAEAQILIDLLASGVSVYVEGSDVWGFDPPTSFADYDGVLGRSTGAPSPFTLDGDDSFTSMNGAAHDGLDFTALTAVPYYQDNTDPLVAAGNDSTDRILPTQATQPIAVDIPGANAGVIWVNNPDATPDPLASEAAYSTAIYYVPDEECRGRVICQSWEFGGFGGNLSALATDYLTQLKNLQPGLGFRRGNCNDDTSINIADVIFFLGFLFGGGNSTPPNCEDACDANDDGGLNIADAIALLASLFGSPTHPLPAPLCPCGLDPTADILDCVSYNSLDCQ